MAKFSDGNKAFKNNEEFENISDTNRVIRYKNKKPYFDKKTGNIILRETRTIVSDKAVKINESSSDNVNSSNKALSAFDSVKQKVDYVSGIASDLAEAVKNDSSENTDSVSKIDDKMAAFLDKRAERFEKEAKSNNKKPSNNTDKKKDKTKDKNDDRFKKNQDKFTEAQDKFKKNIDESLNKGADKVKDKSKEVANDAKDKAVAVVKLTALAITGGKVPDSKNTQGKSANNNQFGNNSRNNGDHSRFCDSNDKFSAQNKFSDPSMEKFASVDASIFDDHNDIRFSIDVKGKSSVFMAKSKDKFEEDAHSQIDDSKKDPFLNEKDNKNSDREKDKDKKKDKKKDKNKSKSSDKDDDNAKRKAGITKSVSNVLKNKSALQKELMFDGEVSGDLLADGNSGVTQIITSKILNFGKSIKNLVVDGIKLAVAALIKLLLHLLVWLAVTIGPYILVAILFVVLFFSIADIFMSGDDAEDISAEQYEVDVNISGLYTETPLTESEIDDIIDEIYEEYDDIDSRQEQVVRYVLSKVGCAYSQASHFNLFDNIYDCSELAYLSYLQVGIDISNNGLYSAAEECRAMDNKGYTLTGSVNFKPADLIFYGNSDNGRYKGVYHVAIYIGKINGVDRMVEAYGESKGVIESDVRTKNIVSISRPIQ